MPIRIKEAIEHRKQERVQKKALESSDMEVLHVLYTNTTGKDLPESEGEQPKENTSQSETPPIEE